MDGLSCTETRDLSGLFFLERFCSAVSAVSAPLRAAHKNENGTTVVASPLISVAVTSITASFVVQVYASGQRAVAALVRVLSHSPRLLTRGLLLYVKHRLGIHRC